MRVGTVRAKGIGAVHGGWREGREGLVMTGGREPLSVPGKLQCVRDVCGIGMGWGSGGAILFHVEHHRNA